MAREIPNRENWARVVAKSFTFKEFVDRFTVWNSESELNELDPEDLTIFDSFGEEIWGVMPGSCHCDDLKKYLKNGDLVVFAEEGMFIITQ